MAQFSSVLARVRNGVAYFSPALVIGTYLAADGFSWWSAGLMAFLAQQVGLLALVVCLSAVISFCAIKVDGTTLGMEAMGYRGTAALLLVAVVYVWLQTGRGRAIERIADCMNALPSVEWTSSRPGDLVRLCATEYEADRADDY